MSATRSRRRAASRLRVRQQRRRVALAALIAIIGIAIALKGSGSSSGGHHHQASAHRAPAIVPGGPLAPASVGGLASLWAPQNVVGTQPGGYVLVADRGNNRVLVLSPQGQVVFTYPTPEDLSQGRRLVYNDDTFVEPGGQSLIANEEDNHAIVRIGLADHSLTVLFGHPGEPGSNSTHLRTPDDAYTLPDGSFTVADAYNCRILFIKEARIVREYGHSGECTHDPPRYFGAVNGDTPVPGGGVLVSEITGSWIDEIGPQGRLVFAVRAPVEYPSDPQPLPGGRILLADYASPGAILIVDQRGNALWRYKRLQGYGRLDHPSLAMALPNGNIAVNDDYRDRVVVIDPRRNEIVWQYGHTDTPGTARGYLNTPDGMDFVPAGPRGGPDYAAVVHP